MNGPAALTPFGRAGPITAQIFANGAIIDAIRFVWSSFRDFWAV
jgi:hypothetical protein